MPVNRMEKCGLDASKTMLPDGQVSTHRKDSSGMPQSSDLDLALLVTYIEMRKAYLTKLQVTQLMGAIQ